MPARVQPKPAVTNVPVVEAAAVVVVAHRWVLPALVEVLQQVAVSDHLAAVVAVVAAQLRAHSAGEAVNHSVAASRNVRNVKNLSSRMRPSSAACRFLAAMGRKSVSVREHPSRTSLKKSTSTQQHW